MQFISLLLSFLLALLPGIPFLAPLNNAVQEYSMSWQARVAITEEQLAHAAAIVEETNAALAQVDLAFVAPFAPNGLLDFFPVNLFEDYLQALFVAYCMASYFSVEDGLAPAVVVRI